MNDTRNIRNIEADELEIIRKFHELVAETVDERMRDYPAEMRTQELEEDWRKMMIYNLSNADYLKHSDSFTKCIDGLGYYERLRLAQHGLGDLLADERQSASTAELEIIRKFQQVVDATVAERMADFPSGDADDCRDMVIEMLCDHDYLVNAPAFQKAMESLAPQERLRIQWAGLANEQVSVLKPYMRTRYF